MNASAELAAPDRRYGKLPSRASSEKRHHHHLCCEIKLYTFNQLPLCGFPTGPDPTTYYNSGQFPICAADPSPTGGALSVIRTLLSNPLPPKVTSNIMNGLSPRLQEEKNNYVNGLQKHPLHYQPKIWIRRSVRCFFG